MSKLDYLGLGRIYGDRQTRDLVVDTDSIRRGEFAGDEEFSGRDDDWDDDDDEFGEEVEGDDDFGDELEGDDVEGEDDFGDEVEGDDELGATRRRRGKGKGKGQSRTSRSRKSRSEWGTTIVTGEDSFTAAAGGDADSFTIPIRLQHKFKAQDITFELTNLSGAKVQSVMFGDRPVWTANGSGVSTSLFSTNSFLRGLLKGQKLREGLDITVNGTMTAAAAGVATVTAAITGLKPTPVC